HRGREHDVAEDHARAGARVGRAGHAEDPGAHEDPDQSRVGLDDAELAPETTERSRRPGFRRASGERHGYTAAPAASPPRSASLLFRSSAALATWYSAST